MILTIAIIHKDSQVLLGMKKIGFGAGRWNGFGGKVKDRETIEEAAKRELYEEAGIRADNPEKIRVLNFEFTKNPGEILETHIFKVREFNGEPVESEEMAPKWFDAGEIPFDEMWSDDIYWFPLFLADKKFRGRFLFDDDDKVLEKELKEVDIL